MEIFLNGIWISIILNENYLAKLNFYNHNGTNVSERLGAEKKNYTLQDVDQNAH